MKPSRFAAARRLLAALLTLALVVELVPTTALAQMTRLDDEAVLQLVEPLALADESADGPAQALAQAADRLLEEAGDEAGEADVVKLAFATLAHAQALARLEADAAAEEVVAEELDTTPAEEATDPATAATTPAEVTANEVQDALSGKLVSDGALVHALALLLRTVGIDAIEVSWPADETHDQARTWLLVQVDGTWYHVDLATTMAEVTSELGDIEFAKTVEDVQWKARLGENCAWLLASDEEMRAGNEARGAWVPAKGELEALNLTELPACPDAYEWTVEQAEPEDALGEDAAVEAEAKPEEDNKVEVNNPEVEEVVTEPVETNAKPDAEEAAQEDIKPEGDETDRDVAIVDEAAAEEGEDPEALAAETDSEQPAGEDPEQQIDTEGQLSAEEDGSEISDEVPTLEEGAPEGDVVDRTVSSVTSRRLSTPAPQKEQDENAAPEPTDDALAEAEGANEAVPEAELDATSQIDATIDAPAEAPTDEEPTEADAAKPNPEDLERVELELHLYQTGWMPTQEEQEGIELEAMASTLTTRQR